MEQTEKQLKPVMWEIGILGKIEQIEVESFTDRTVLVKRHWAPTPRREKRPGNFFDSWAEARDALIARCELRAAEDERRVEYHRRNLERSKSALAHARSIPLEQP